MNIVIRNSDGAVMMVANAPATGFDPTLYTTYALPNWDWSKANLTGVPNPIPSGHSLLEYLKWDGTTLVKK